MSAAPTFSLPRLIGHRGAAAIAPENTLAGFRAAAEAGAAAVEFDVRLSGDGVPMVIHDATLARTTNARGAVGTSTAAELGAVDAGAWFAPRFAGEGVPTLEAAIAEIAALGLDANIELKSAGDGARRLTEAVTAAVARAWPADRPPPLLSSFDAACVALCRELAPDLPRALLVDRPGPASLAAAEALRCFSIHADHRRLDEKLTRMVKTAGWRLAVYTVDDPARARRLLDWGVDALFTNDPGRLRRALFAG